MRIRKADPSELERIMELYRHARTFMAANGNPSQWGTAYPGRELVEADLRNGDLYVCEEEDAPERGCDSRKRLTAVFYYRVTDDPAYRRIWQGTWLNDRAYGVVHRITSDGTVKGTAGFCLDWAFRQCGNLKIDTHRDNHIMQHLLEKKGFTYCGIIHTDNGAERLAYQKSSQKNAAAGPFPAAAASLFTT